MLNTTIIIALFNTCLLLCFKKWGWLDLYQAWCVKWMRYVIGPADCFFCLAIRLGIILCAVMWCVWGYDWQYFFIPFCAAPITSFLTMAVYYDGHQNQR
jgi:hypothetical protein